MLRGKRELRSPHDDGHEQSGKIKEEIENFQSRLVLGSMYLLTALTCITDSILCTTYGIMSAIYTYAIYVHRHPSPDHKEGEISLLGQLLGDQEDS